jgi:chorismate synthase
MPLRFLTSGESHGAALMAILEGLPAGLSLTAEMIDYQLARRQRGYGAGPRMAIEHDRVVILSGVMGGVTIGSPITMQIENRDHPNWRGKSIKAMTNPRPGHADLTAAIKYGYRDLRLSLERASARETASRVAVGAVCGQYLAAFGIQIGGYVSAIGDVSMDVGAVDLITMAQRADSSDVCCPDPDAAVRMREIIHEARESGDTLGGMLEVFAIGLPPGLGSHVHWDRRLDSRLGGAVLGIQAVKGVEIGPAFANAKRRGTQAQDALHLEDDRLVRPTNHSGGLEGGITTGQPLQIRAAMKPIASTIIPQATVDLALGKETETQYERSDTCPVPRALPIVEAVVAFILADALIEKIGGDSLDEMRPRFESLRRARLSDLTLDNQEHIFWGDSAA